MRPAARLDGLGTTIFTEMTALAARTGAINLGQAFPDADGPDLVIEAAVVAIPTGVFYDDKTAAPTLVRFAFCKRDATIAEAAARLATLRP